MKQIIINADDFGINETVTFEIERMIEKGCVTSTTVMANGKCLEEVKRFASLHPEISFGVHLCLSEFESVTKSEGLCRAGLTDENGTFIRKAIFSLKNLEDAFVQEAIKEELLAQIEVVKSLGFPISHADSHHHVHTIYSLREVFVEVLKVQGIRKVRLGMNYQLHSRIHVKGWLHREWLNGLYKKNFVTTDAFYGYAGFVKDGYKHKREKVVELMCHPGHSAERYQAEMKQVQEGEHNKANEVKLISFLDLSK